VVRTSYFVATYQISICIHKLHVVVLHALAIEVKSNVLAQFILSAQEQDKWNLHIIN
jgi:hypothetical protein